MCADAKNLPVDWAQKPPVVDTVAPLEESEPRASQLALWWNPQREVEGGWVMDTSDSAELFTEGRDMAGGKLKVVGSVLGACLMVVGLTGCNNVSKDKYNALQQENTDLHGKVTELQTSNREKDIQLTGLQGELANARATPAPQPQVTSMPPTDDGRGTARKAPRTETLEIAGDVAFLSGSATLTTAAKKELDTFASKLKNTYAGRSVRVEGHTDSTPIKKSKWGSNEALSQARAEAVKTYLVSKGVSSGRIEAIGYGAAKPKGSPSASRRVDVVVLAD